MKPSEKFAPYRRAEFLRTVSVERRALAERLCALLESAFDPKDITIYAGFPIVVRDMEWIAGFAMRVAGPVAYCCSPATLAELGAELKPYMSGKSCVAVKPRKGESIETVLALVGRAFATASRHGGMICKADARKRERLRAATGAATANTSTAKSTARSTSKSGVSPAATMKRAAAKSATAKAARRSTSARSVKPTRG